MALDAQLLDGPKIDEMFVLRTMRPMTTEAFHRDVSVPGIHDILANRMCRMRLPLMAGFTKIKR